MPSQVGLGEVPGFQGQLPGPATEGRGPTLGESALLPGLLQHLQMGMARGRKHFAAEEHPEVPGPDEGGRAYLGRNSNPRSRHRNPAKLPLRAPPFRANHDCHRPPHGEGLRSRPPLALPRSSSGADNTALALCGSGRKVWSVILTAASDPMTSTIVSPAAGWGDLAGEGTPR